MDAVIIVVVVLGEINTHQPYLIKPHIICEGNTYVGGRDGNGYLSGGEVSIKIFDFPASQPELEKMMRGGNVLIPLGYL